MIPNIVLILIFVGILIVPVVLQYVLNWKLAIVSVYGIYVLTYTVIQFIFAFINNKYGNKYTNIISLKNSSLCNMMIVGWKEKEEYYKMCLDSVKDVILDTSCLNRVYIIIDGNEESDMYMVDIAKKVFKEEHEYINLESVMDEEIVSTLDKIMTKKVIVISQPHSNKRMAMYTGFKLSILEKNVYNEKIQTIFCTDSDTVVSSGTLDDTIDRFKHEMVGGVTGNLSIYNRYNSYVSFTSKIRYWFAFNLERAYQSFNGCVLCVSGPLGMYRLNSVEKILDNWKSQKFIGKECTYGDDRHLSNLILSMGEKIIYDQAAYAETETPETIYRFYKQQVRWSKSSFREFLWSINNVDKQSLFMTVDLVYVLIYPFIVMGYMMYLLWYGTLFELGVYLNTIYILGLIKALYGTIVSGIWENLFYVFYGINYVSIVFPSKLWAMLTITDNDWGTTTRKIGTIENVSYDIIMLILWNMNLLCGFGYALWRNINTVSIIDWILLGVPVGFMIMGIIMTKLYVYLRKGVIDDKKMV